MDAVGEHCGYKAEAGALSESQSVAKLLQSEVPLNAAEVPVDAVDQEGDHVERHAASLRVQLEHTGQATSARAKQELVCAASVSVEQSQEARGTAGEARRTRVAQLSQRPRASPRSSARSKCRGRSTKRTRRATGCSRRRSR